MKASITYPQNSGGVEGPEQNFEVEIPSEVTARPLAPLAWIYWSMVWSDDLPKKIGRRAMIAGDTVKIGEEVYRCAGDGFVSLTPTKVFFSTFYD